MLEFDLDEIRNKYKKERHLYQALAKYIAEKADSEIRHREIKDYNISYRAKEVDSYVKKALRPEYLSKQKKIKDKAGVRITVTYFKLLEDISSIIYDIFHVKNRQDKIDSLDPDRLGYLGIHLEVSLPPEIIDNETRDFESLICEVQLRTQAQGLWANISHELLYKPNARLPVEFQRTLYRLIALVEIFDNEVTDVKAKHDLILGSDETRLLNAAEKKFRRFAKQTYSYDKELSFEVVKIIQAAYSPSEVKGIDELLGKFAEKNGDKITDIFRNYLQDERRSPLLFQPEIMLIFERLDKDEFTIREIWEKNLPISLFEQIESIWGHNL